MKIGLDFGVGMALIVPTKLFHVVSGFTLQVVDLHL